MFRYLGIWFRAARPYSLTASVIPVLMGTSLAAQAATLNPLIFSLTLLGSILIQVGTNLIDEYSDHIKKHTELKFPAPHKVIQLNFLTPRAVLFGARLCFGIASLMGLYLVTMTGWPILVIGIASLLAAYFHSAGPSPLGSRGLGELTVFIFMGPVMVLATYYAQTGEFSTSALWSSIPIAFLVTAILVANNIRDMEEDLASGKATLATLWGRRSANTLYYALVLGSFPVIILMVLFSQAPLTLLAALILLPRAISFVRFMIRADDRSSLHQALRETAGLHLWFGLVMVAGFVSAPLLPALKGLF